MRNIVNRPPLNTTTTQKLNQSKNKILSKSDTERKNVAEREFKRVRQLKWFKENVVETLKDMSGTGNRCMYCSNSASSDVEHFYPKSVFPEKTFDWDNMLWICTQCNRKKENSFSTNPDGEPILIDPVSENIWNFMFIDEFGMLSPKYDITTDLLNERAEKTIEIFGLESEERDYLRRNRCKAIKDITEKVKQLMESIKSEKITKDEAENELEDEKKTSLRPDVTDYFLNGPGKNEEPFKTLFKMLGE